MADISSINLNGNSYNIKDNNAVTKNDVIDVAHGGTGTTTLPEIRKELFPSNLNTTAQYLAGIQQNYADGGAVKLPLSTLLGGTGNANGTVAKLTTARNIQINLASTTAVSFNGSADITPGVTGTLEITNGGTGKTTKDAAWTNLGGGNIGKKNSLAATDIPKLNASKITAGTFDADRIPSLDAGKITTGTFGTDRIPNLDADKITTGTFNANRIPGLNASKITAGTLPVSHGGTSVTTYSALAPKVGISTLQIGSAKQDTYTLKSDTNGEFAIIFCGRGGRAGIYIVDYNTANSIKVFNVGSIDPLITIQHSANNKDITITNNNSVTMKITIIEMNTTE